jgi:hypothetical protein
MLFREQTQRTVHLLLKRLKRQFHLFELKKDNITEFPAGALSMNMVDKDYIIVGSGPGGATVAKELSQRKKKVLILEWGDNNPLTGSFWWGTKSFLWPGRSLLFTPQMLGLVRGIASGGSTIFYYATCFPVPFDMLKSYGVDITVEVEEARAAINGRSWKSSCIRIAGNRSTLLATMEILIM